MLLWDKIKTLKRNEKILRQISKEATWEEVEKINLINRLRTMNDKAWTEGCGLSAIQIGIPLRVAWFVLDGKEEILFNPKITSGIGSVDSKEGCLSIPNRYTTVKRNYTIEYISDGKKKKAKGFRAKVIQHEIDHMDGILNIDKEILWVYEPQR